MNQLAEFLMLVCFAAIVSAIILAGYLLMERQEKKHPSHTCPQCHGTGRIYDDDPGPGLKQWY